MARVHYVHWRVSGEYDTLMLARFGWWRFEVHWPDYDQGRVSSTYPLKVYHRDQLKCIYQISSIHSCVAWIMETCEDIALAVPVEEKYC